MLIDETIFSGSISLRNLTEDECSLDYVSWLNDKEINRYTESRFQKHGYESTLEFIENNNASDQSLLLGIFYNHQHIGNVRAVFDWRHKIASIGILIGISNKRGRGIGTEVIKIFSRYIFRELKVFKINAGLYESNIASYKAFEKAGYKVEYRKISHVINADNIREDVIMMVKYEH